MIGQSVGSSSIEFMIIQKKNETDVWWRSLYQKLRKEKNRDMPTNQTTATNNRKQGKEKKKISQIPRHPSFTHTKHQMPK